MKDINNILFIIQARMQSERVPQKMLKTFGDSSLFEIAINKILSSSLIPKNNFYVSVFENELKVVASKYGINIFHRSFESANNDNDLRTIYEWHDKLNYKYVIKINGCSPLLKISTIDEFINTFLIQKEESLFGVIKTKDYYWNENGDLLTNWLSDQTIMNTKVVEITYKAAHVLYASRMDLIKNNMFMGNFNKQGDIKLYPMDEMECFDIDYEWEFELGKKLWEMQN